MPYGLERLIYAGYKREGARATWEEYLALSELYTLIIKQFPIKTQELLINSRPFNLYVRDYQKLDFNWLPQVTIAEHLVELRDGIYNLRTGEFKPLFEDTNLGLISCSTFWPQFTFQNLPWPSPFIDILSRLRFDKAIIGVISNTKSDFQLATLKNKRIAILNEFESDFINIAELKLLLEAAQGTTAVK